MTDRGDDEEPQLPRITNYPEWKSPCPEDHRGPPRFVKSCLYKGMLLHFWGPGTICVTPFADLAGAVVNLSDRLYPDEHGTGKSQTRCRAWLAETEEPLTRALAFVDGLWAEAEKAIGVGR